MNDHVLVCEELYGNMLEVIIFRTIHDCINIYLSSNTIIWNDCAIILHNLMKWLCNIYPCYLKSIVYMMIVQMFAQSYVNDCAIRWLLACMNVVATLVWFSKNLCNHMKWLCNQIVQAYELIVQCHNTNMSKAHWTSTKWIHTEYGSI